MCMSARLPGTTLRTTVQAPCSYRFDDTPLGSMKAGIPCEDLQRRTFADDSCDVFITGDVLEHGFHSHRALSETMRVLRPGGTHVLTAPKHKNLLRGARRAGLDDNGEVTHLATPEYHRNPIDRKEARSPGLQLRLRRSAAGMVRLSHPATTRSVIAIVVSKATTRTSSSPARIR